MLSYFTAPDLHWESPPQIHSTLPVQKIRSSNLIMACRKTMDSGWGPKQRGEGWI